LNLTNS